MGGHWVGGVRLLGGGVRGGPRVREGGSRWRERAVARAPTAEPAAQPSPPLHPPLHAALSERVGDKPVKVQLCGKEMVLFRWVGS